MFFFFRARPCRSPSQLVGIDESSNTVVVADDANQPNSRRPSPKRQAMPVSVPRRHLCSFDGVFNSQTAYSQQEDVFNAVAPRLIEAIQQGTGCTIVTYGGAASGKTYTLQGVIGSDPKLHGLAPRAIALIFDTLEKAAVAIEASFFEIVGDALFDLLPKDLRSRVSPGVGIKEIPNSAQVVINHCTQHRCDGSLQRAIECYRAGVEKLRRNASASCFQVALSYPTADGRGSQKSFIRFVELAATRPNAATPRSLVQQRSVGALPKAVPAGGMTPNSLEQVLTAKVSGDARLAYKGSPVGLLLKPCFEGAMPMLFLLCARLEEPHVATLQGACRVLKLLQQLNLHLAKVGVTDSGHLQAECRLREVPTPSRPADVQAILQVQSPCESTVQQARSQSPMPPRPPALAAAFPVSYDATQESHRPQYPGSPGTYNMYADAVSTAAEPVNELDARAVKTCYESLCVKKRAADCMAEDTRRSALALDEIQQIIVALQNQRTASEGPAEKETKMKMLFEKMNQSLQRGLLQLKVFQEEMDTLAMVCDGQSLPEPQPAYDSYNVKAADIEAMKKFHAASSPALSSMQPTHQVPSARSGRSNGALATEASPGLMPQRSATGSASTPVIPSLHLDQLAPTEEQQQAVPAQATGDGGTSGLPNIEGAESSSSEGSLSPELRSRQGVKAAIAPSPSAPTILVPAASHSDSSTPKAGAKRAVGVGGRKGSSGSQPKQKSLMRQVSRTSLLDLHDDGTQAPAEGNGLSHTDVAELLHNTIHSDDELEMVDVKVIECSPSPMACEDMGTMTPGPTHGTFTPLRPMESPMVSPMVSPMMTPMVPPAVSGPCIARCSVPNRMSPPSGNNMVKSFSSTSLQQSPTPVHPPPPSVVASPYIKHRLDYTGKNTSGQRTGATSPLDHAGKNTAGQRTGATSPPTPQCRMVWPFDRGVQLVPSPVHPPRSQTPQPLGPNLNGGSAMANAAWPGKSASPMGRRPTKLNSPPTQAPSTTGISCSPHGYPSGYVAVSAVNRSASVKHLAGF